MTLATNIPQLQLGCPERSTSEGAAKRGVRRVRDQCGRDWRVLHGILLRQVPGQSRGHTSFEAADSRADVLAEHREERVVYLLGSDSDLLSARSLARLVPGLTDRDVYVCASPGMSAALRRSLREAGLPGT